MNDRNSRIDTVTPFDVISELSSRRKASKVPFPLPAVILPSSDHFLRIKDVCRITALSQSFIYALQAKDQFPKSRRIASKVSVWLASDVHEWMQQQWDQAA